jgi:hypothetical protein
LALLTSLLLLRSQMTAIADTHNRATHPTTPPIIAPVLLGAPLLAATGAPVVLVLLDVEFEVGAGVKRLPVSVGLTGGEGTTLERAVSLDVAGTALVVWFVVKAQYRSVVGALPHPM